MPEPSENRPKLKKLFWLGLGLFGASMAFNAAADYYFTDAKSKNEISYDNFVAKVKDGEIKGNVSLQYTDIKSLRVSVPEQKEYFTTTREGDAKTRPPIPYYTITSQGEEKVRSDLQGASREVTPVYIAPEPPNAVMSFVTNWGPTLLFIGFFAWMLTRATGGGAGGALGFGKSKAKMLKQEDAKVKFADVAGADEAKEDMADFVQFLKNPHEFQRLGGKMPKGALMVGPPGTGKTLLAKAVAGEAGVPFLSISGSEFVEMFVGVGASRVRDLFETARKQAPCIIFIDEIDAVGRHRGAGIGGGHDEKEQTLNQLLVEMDGFDTSAGIIIIAATNRPDVLDPALLRPGRFDRQVVVDRPEVRGREQILGVHTRKLEERAKKEVLAPDVDLAVLARGTPGFSGADIENLVNEAALFATKRGAELVSMQDFEEAKDKVMMGAQRKSMIMTPEERRLTAYHEAGHALVGLKVPGNDPLHKVTILPRGRALGVTMNLPERDRLSITRAQLMSRMAMMFGGRVAEEIVNGGPDNVTTGASNDITQATDMAYKMVTEWGMSDKLGRVRYAGNQEDVFIGMSVAKQKNMSEETARLVDSEVRALTDAAESKARDVLTTHQSGLHKIAEALLEHETLSGHEIQDILAGKPLQREHAPVAASSPDSGQPTIN